MSKPNLIISLGGSLIVPDQIDSVFLKAFRRVILKNQQRYNKIVMVCGGGRTARQYIAGAVGALPSLSDTEKDWLGIHVGCLNGYLLKLLFKNARKIIVANATLDQDQGLSYCRAVGIGPNHSSDYISVRLAKKYGANEILNLSNIEYIYDKNPETHPAAKKLEKVSWREFRQMMGSKWIPSGNFPFDPVASQLAEKLKMRVHVMNGRNLKNLDRFLQGQRYKGSVIE